MAGLSGMRVVVVSCLVFCATSCSRHDQRLQDHLKALHSTAASVDRIAETWLDGETSGTYTTTALAQLLISVEAERSGLTATPALIIDARGAALADAAGELSRRIALMIAAARNADASAMRQQLHGLPFGAS